ncbi:MAG: hypothetical protein ACSHW0_13795 [Thalassotalea sp.]
MRRLAVESIGLPSTAVIVLPGTFQAEVSFTPNNATDLEVTWKSVNSSIARIYRFIIDAGTPIASGTGVEVFINSMSAGVADIPATGDWDVMQSNVVSNNLLIPTAGIHNVRIQSVGAEGAWQWNADKLSFVLLSSITPTLDPDPVERVIV